VYLPKKNPIHFEYQLLYLQGNVLVYFTMYSSMNQFCEMMWKKMEYWYLNLNQHFGMGSWFECWKEVTTCNEE